MLTRTIKLFAPVLFAASLAIGGCASTSSSIDADENIAANSEAATATADAPHGPRGERGHPLLAAALHELDLSAEQRKTIESAIDDLHTRQNDPKKAFHKALADDVRAGKVDEAALQAQAGDMDKAAAEHRAAVVKAVATLHATLTPAQRTQLVTFVKERMHEHSRHEGKPDLDEKNGEHHARHGGPIMFMLHGIDLRDDQKKAIEAAMPAKPDVDQDDKAEKFEQHRARMDAALEAFKGDKFDAASVLPEHDGKSPRADRFVKMLQVVVPILDTEQRAQLAKRIEEGPRMGHHRGKHGHHGRGPGHEDAAE